MGSPEEGTTAGKPSNPKLTAAPPAAAVTPPPATVASPVMMAYPDWGAYYASGAAASGAAFFPPAAWGGQPLIPTYGGQIPFSPVYYAHPSMSAGTPYLNQESEGNGKEQVSANKSTKAATQKSVDGGKVTSGSADDDATQSGETGSDGSSATRDESTDPQNSSTSRKRMSNEAFAEGEAAQGGIKYCSATSESSHGGRVPKLPVSAPGRAALPGLATNLNIGMDAWNAGAGPVKPGQNAVNFAPLMPGREGVMPEHQWMQKDERELKRERRKQSNRESARRSRLRKQVKSAE